jgi:hypothetical protein
MKIKGTVMGRKPGLFINLVNFHAPGTGSASQYRSGFRTANSMRIRIHNTAKDTIQVHLCRGRCTDKSRIVNDPDPAFQQSSNLAFEAQNAEF